ncbi:MAG: hypothetical protein LBF24_04005 [Puniceicoccales bacterium]|nr:hypothetical protein [Puniceicoccales bacterium]
MGKIELSSEAKDFLCAVAAKVPEKEKLKELSPALFAACDTENPGIRRTYLLGCCSSAIQCGKDGKPKGNVAIGIGLLAKEALELLANEPDNVSSIALIFGGISNFFVFPHAKYCDAGASENVKRELLGLANRLRWHGC